MIAEIPSEWRDLLERIQVFAPSALIAGGAVRDWYLGQTPRDIDIFVGDMVPKHEFQAIGLEEIADSYIESAEHDDSVSASAGFNGYSLPVNVIWCARDTEPMDRFTRFDFGICKAAFNGKEVILHNEFHWDVKYRIFTLRRASNPQQTMESFYRYNRLKQRYPYSLVIPADLTLPFYKDAL